MEIDKAHYPTLMVKEPNWLSDYQLYNLKGEWNIKRLFDITELLLIGRLFRSSSKHMDLTGTID